MNLNDLKVGDQIVSVHESETLFLGRRIQPGEIFSVARYSSKLSAFKLVGVNEQDFHPVVSAMTVYDHFEPYSDHATPGAQGHEAITCSCGQVLNPETDVSPNDGRLVCWKCGGRP